MAFGLKKVASATVDIKVADCSENLKSIKQLIDRAAAQQADLLVLPELCITGYTCGDLFLQSTLLSSALRAVEEAAGHTRGKALAVVLGAPLEYCGKLYNCGLFLYDGEVLGVVPKSFIPNYSEFYELRYFTPAPASQGEIELCGKRVPFGTDILFSCAQDPSFTIALEICEDLWVPASPGQRHALNGATVIANLSASDETIGKEEYRRALVGMTSAKLMCTYVYADAGSGESTQDMVFGGQNLICENGRVLAESALFQNSMITAQTDIEKLSCERRRMNTFPPADRSSYRTVVFSQPDKDILELVPERRPFVPSDPLRRSECCRSILAMQVQGLKTRIEHTGCKNLVIGISGGLDSSLALLVSVKAMEALGRSPRDILAVTMPCFGTTRRTRGNAELLCSALGVSFEEINITESVLQHFRDIGHSENDHNVVFENSQARERTQVLMDKANACGGLVIGTGDLSELALGWATYNGDHMSMYGVNASVPKTLVRHIVSYAAEAADSEELRRVLEDILATPVSPELLPAEKGEISQKTEDIVGPYDLHDFFLFYLVRYGFSPLKIFALACRAFEGEFAPEVILKWLRTFCRRFFSQQFKRSCLPDGPKIGSVTLSPRGDLRMPSDASARAWLDELDSIRL